MLFTDVSTEIFYVFTELADVVYRNTRCILYRYPKRKVVSKFPLQKPFICLSRLYLTSFPKPVPKPRGQAFDELSQHGARFFFFFFPFPLAYGGREAGNSHKTITKMVEGDVFFCLFDIDFTREK